MQPEVPASTPARSPWRRVRRIVLGPASIAVAVAALGWFATPGPGAVISIVLGAVGVPGALLYSVFLVVKRRDFDEKAWRREVRRVAVLVVTLAFLVPANMIPISGKRRVLKWRGRAAAEALEAHHRAHGSFPEKLGDADGAPWFRWGLQYTGSSSDYDLCFENPGLDFISDPGSWRWDRGARSWKYVYEGS